MSDEVNILILLTLRIENTFKLKTFDNDLDPHTLTFLISNDLAKQIFDLEE